jgi:hypothetical protein
MTKRCDTSVVESGLSKRISQGFFIDLCEVAVGRMWRADLVFAIETGPGDDRLGRSGIGSGECSDSGELALSRRVSIARSALAVEAPVPIGKPRLLFFI